MRRRGPKRTDTLRWWIGEILRYWALRRSYDRQIILLEHKIADAMGVSAPEITSRDRQLYPRLHTHAWLEVVAGLSLELEPSMLLAQYGEHQLRLEAPTLEHESEDLSTSAMS